MLFALCYMHGVIHRSEPHVLPALLCPAHCLSSLVLHCPCIVLLGAVELNWKRVFAVPLANRISVSVLSSNLCCACAVPCHCGTFRAVLCIWVVLSCAVHASVLCM